MELSLRNSEIMTWAQTNSQTLNQMAIQVLPQLFHILNTTEGSFLNVYLFPGYLFSLEKPGFDIYETVKFINTFHTYCQIVFPKMLHFPSLQQMGITFPLTLTKCQLFC